MTRLDRWIFGSVWAAAVILLIVSFGPLAYGHGDAEWIQQAHPSCCGVHDCERVPPGMLVEADGGWSAADFLSQVYTLERVEPSVDGDVWWCRVLSGERKGWIRCLFMPDVGV